MSSSAPTALTDRVLLVEDDVHTAAWLADLLRREPHLQLAAHCANVADALAWLADEPFTRAGLYARSEVHAFANLWPQRTGFPPPPAA